MSSPPRHKGSRSPPKRAALHERSESQTNERTLRLVGEPQAPIYGSPFPTKPSQILSPRSYGGQGPSEGAQLAVPHSLKPSNETRAVIEDTPTVATSRNLQEDPGNEDHEHDVPTIQRFSTDASYHTSSSLTTGMDPSTSFLEDEEPEEESGRLSDDIVQLPSVRSRAETFGPLTSSNTLNPSFRQPVATKESDSSLSSSNSTGTVIVKRNRHGGKRASYSAFPTVARPSSSRSNLSVSPPQKSASKEPEERYSQISPVSPISPDSPEFAGPSERRISSVPMYTNLQAASHSSLNLQYPVIRPPSASASWVEAPTSAPQRVPRIPDRNPDRWNPHLSTVPSVRSEATGSQSEGRNSQHTWLESSRVSKASSSMGANARGSSDLPPIPSPQRYTGNVDTEPLPSPPPIHPRNYTGSTIRVVDEQEDRPLDVPPTIPGSRDSTHLDVPSADNRNSVVTRPSSRASFFRDSIPAWAK